jgi:hypothetical protein
MPRLGICLLLLMSAQDPHTSERGAMVMGFDQAKTSHHFLVYEDGGAIDIAVNNAADAKDLAAIRSHLPHIAMMFGDGNFDAPMLVHDTKDVPGIKTLAARKDQVRYNYVQTPKGGRVDIVSTDPAALSALHEFLQYQIKEHHTGDSGIVMKRP